MAYHQSSEGQRFADPSIDPSVFLELSSDSFEFLAQNMAWKLLEEIYRRFPTAEYAIGFDGVDDSIRIGPLDLLEGGIDVETEVWVSEGTHANPILSIVNDDGDAVAGISINTERSTEGYVFYRQEGLISSRPVLRLGSGVWRKIRLWSDGGVLSVEIDGAQTALVPNIDLTDEEYRIEIGTSPTVPGHLEGSMKSLKILNGSNDVVRFQSSKSESLPRISGHLDRIGVHRMKKGGFHDNFQFEPHTR